MNIKKLVVDAFWFIFLIMSDLTSARFCACPNSWWCEPRLLCTTICFLLHCFVWNSSILITSCNPVTFSLKCFDLCLEFVPRLLRNVVNNKGENSLSKVTLKEINTFIWIFHVQSWKKKIVAFQICC